MLVNVMYGSYIQYMKYEWIYHNNIEDESDGFIQAMENRGRKASRELVTVIKARSSKYMYNSFMVSLREMKTKMDKVEMKKHREIMNIYDL